VHHDLDQLVDAERRPPTTTQMVQQSKKRWRLNATALAGTWPERRFITRILHGIAGDR